MATIRKNLFTKNNVIISVISIALLVGSNTMSFAYDSETKIDENAYTKEEYMIRELEEIQQLAEDQTVQVLNAPMKNGSYVVDAENTRITIPINGKENICLALKDTADDAVISLPEYASSMNSKACPDGTVYYSNDSKEVSFAVQAITELSDDDSFAGIRQVALIEASSAPNTYDITYNCGKDCAIVYAEWVPDCDFITNSDEAMYLINGEGEIVLEIDTPQAQDANGDPVQTHYEISGNTIKQVVEFDDSSAFPIVAGTMATAAKTGITYGSKHYEKKSGYPNNQGIKGFSGKDTYINVNLTHKLGASASVAVSYTVPVPGAGDVGVSGTIQIPIGRATGTSGTVTSVSCKIPDNTHWYKAKVTTTYQCTPWALWRQLKNGKQITDKGIDKKRYGVKCVAVNQGKVN